MIFKTSFYHSKKILLVEDCSPVRAAIKSMLQQIGFEHITAVADASSARNSASQHKFDFILADYHLGDDQNALQLLSELSQQKLLKSSCCFVLISSEPVQLAELALLHGQPDEVMLKPFSYIELEKRLAKAWRQRSHLRKVYHALQLNQLDQAQVELDLVIKSSTTHTLLALRLKGEILLAKKQFSAAQQLYNTILQQRDFSWAKLGLAVALVQLQQTEPAEQLLQQLIEQEQTRPEALQWLCQLHLVSVQLDQAQPLLKELLRLQPNNINGHCALAVSYELAQDYEQASRYWQMLIQQYRFSGFDQADYYLQLTRLLIQQAYQADIPSFNPAIKKASETLASMPQKLNVPTIEHEIKLLQIRITILSGDMVNALEQYQHLNMSIEHSQLSKTALYDYCLLSLAFGDLKLADKVAEQLQKPVFDINPHTENWQSLQAQVLFERYETLKTKLRDWHQSGMLDIKAGQLKLAFVKLRQAFLLMPCNANLALSLLQLLIQFPAHKALTPLVISVLAALESIQLTAEQQQKFSTLASTLPEIYLN